MAFYDIGHRLSGGAGKLQPQLDAMLHAARTCGPWYPMHGVCVIGDRPTVLERDRDGRLHCETGLAVNWSDGWATHWWHGICVPSWVIEDPTPDRILAETNTEIRRCAIESYGWDRYLDHIGATAMSVEPDPGNPGHDLALYDLPEQAQVYDAPVRLLVMDNASLDRDGTRRRFAETVPMECTSAVAAAAWQFDVAEDDYRQLARAT